MGLLAAFGAMNCCPLELMRREIKERHGPLPVGAVPCGAADRGARLAGLLLSRIRVAIIAVIAQLLHFIEQLRKLPLDGLQALIAIADVSRGAG